MTPMILFAIVFVSITDVVRGFVSQAALKSAYSSSTSTLPALASPSTEESIVEKCYKAWNQRKMNDAANFFAPNFTYDDGQYLGSITKKSDLEKLFQRWADALPSNASLVIEKIAKCSKTGNIGTQWHVEQNGLTIPYTSGCSFYTIDEESGLIKTGFKVSEMIVKPSKQFSDVLVNSASNMIQKSENMNHKISTETTTEKTLDDKESSIIESYFTAWNNRDLDAALDCFVEDCTYQTEDPVFVDTFYGKDALREHLERNAAALPSGCDIILDDLAIDSINDTSGVRWHLEVNGVSIPNLRGCSMYTTENRLLKSGFDVTEAPIKLPAFVQDLTIPLARFVLGSGN